MTLQEIQKELKVPKNQFNKFGGYSYRNCEDILEAVKPLLGNSVLTISDDIVEIGGRVYVRATATFTDGDKVTPITGFAREAENKKGMDAAQITGAASSYARKYALNGLFLIDDTKDADSDKPAEEKPVQVNLNQDKLTKRFNELLDGLPMEAVMDWEAKWNNATTDEEKKQIGKELATSRGH